MPNEKFIPVFIDAKPSENIEPSTGQTICFVAVLSSDMKGIPKLKGYKNTKRKLKISSAKRIIEYLENNKIEIDAIGFASRTNGQFVQWACDTINRSRELIGAEWEIKNGRPEYLKWEGKRIHRSIVLGLSAYTSILPIIALGAEILTHQEPVNKIKLCLDALPHNSNLGMSLMEAMKDEETISTLWNENVERGANFEIGILNRWKNLIGKWSPGKKHPMSILVDWFAVSCMANVNPEQLKEEGNYTDSEIETLAQIWASSELPNSTPIRDLDDPVLQQQIRDHQNSN